MRWFGWFRPCPIMLHVMRASDMVLVHPETDWSHVCGTCNEPVGIYPSGQRVLKQNKKVTLICNRCEPVGIPLQLAPGAREERGQSVLNPRL